MSFVHLHNHTQYSVLDGACRTDKMVKLAKKMGMPAVAMTDHGNMFGTVDFYNCAKEEGIKPIIGSEVYVVENDYDHPETKKDIKYHLILLVKNELGYKNLCKLSSISYLQGYYYKPRISKSILRKYSAGLICLSGCIQGEIAQKLLNKKNLMGESLPVISPTNPFLDWDDVDSVGTTPISHIQNRDSFYDDTKNTNSLDRCSNEKKQDTAESIHSKHDAIEALQFYKNIFGEDFYIEIQNHDLADENIVNPMLIELAKQTSTPLVLTNDCHYLDKKDAEAHDVLMCIQTNKVVSESDRMKYPSNLYFKSTEEMKLLFPDIPEAFENTLKISEKINFDLNYDKFLLPKVCLPPEYSDESDYLRGMCLQGIKKKYKEQTTEVTTRLNAELDVIRNMGFSGYFLIIKDFIDYARTKGIPVGPGRGSAAGSIVSYLLDITQLCPLKYGLFFERFLNPERIEMPDIDIDFCAIGRGDVIDYVIDKYGRNSVTQIITFGTLKAKSAIKDVARVMEISPQDANELTKRIPTKPPQSKNPHDDQSDEITLDEAFKQSPEFAEAINSKELYQKIFNYSKALEGLIRQIGVHAAGVVIGPGDLSDYVPLAISPQKDDSVVLVQYDGKRLNDLKMLKMDFLGLKTLTVMKRTLELIKEYRNIDVDIDNIDLFDKQTYSLLSKGETDGIFQFESSGMKKYLRDLKPNKFEDLIVMVALYRPGPMRNIEVYIKRKHGKEKVAYDHPLVEKSLQETYGVTVYQEQVMQVSRDVGGFTGSEADTLRKAMSKKNSKMMGELENKFITGALERGVPKPIINKIWLNWQTFARYAFNKSHAASYAFVAFQTAFLKAHFPIEFMTATLSIEESPEKIPMFIDVAKKMGIEILPPSINESVKDFRIVNKKILFGLNAIKNVGIKAVNAIISERDLHGQFTDFFNLTTRLDVQLLNKSVLEALIIAGVLDKLPGNRASKLSAISNAQQEASKMQEANRNGQLTIFDMMSIDEKIESSPQLPDVKEFDDKTKLEKEKSILGFYLSGHPLEELKHYIQIYANIDTREAALDNAQIPNKIMIIGSVVGLLSKKDKKGNDFIILTLEDLYGRFEVGLFGNNAIRFKSMAVIDNKLLVIGKQNSFKGNNNDSMLKISPESVLMVQDLDNKVKGEITVYANEEDLNKEFAEYIVNFSKKYPGNFKILLKIKIQKEKDTNIEAQPEKYLIIQPQNIRIKPNEEFVNEIQEKRNLFFTCNFDL